MRGVRARRLFRSLAPLVLLASLGACGEAGPAAPRGPLNLLLVSLDTTRADHLSAYGYPRDTSPELRRLASEGVLVTQAYSASASTAPSHATLFTALHPPTHGVMQNGVELGAQWPTLAELLAAAGYENWGVAGSYVLSARFGWARGFSGWDDHFRPDPDHEKWLHFDTSAGFSRRADEVTDAAIRWLAGRSDPERPFFLFVHYFDPHAPYDPPEPFASRFSNDPERSDGIPAAFDPAYDGEIAFTDHEVGRLVAWLEASGALDRTLVVVTGDHGEGLRQRGVFQHGRHIYEEGVRVPLVFRLPSRLPRGVRVESPVSSVDLLPTLIEILLGRPPEGHAFQGRSIAPALAAGEEPGLEHPVFLTRRTWKTPPRDAGPPFAVRVGRWKYFAGSEGRPPELYDLREDPGERHNVAERLPERAASLAARLEAWRGAQAGAGPRAPDLGEAEREGLAALGYTE